ncbi:biopolymer transporter ExbD [bacterium]|nr:biopolymer transporter ExbD [bacterium]MCB1221127.1 biopolymer transporter ExbD [bacterium]UNM09832.1 MAG: biopolymer transporter ExbD [Planctomycetales bacterium]
MKVSQMLESGGGLPFAPMLDVIFLLLIFFMLITRYLPPSLSVTLPEADSAAVDDKPSVMISIDEAGLLAVDGVEYQWEALPRLFEGSDPETSVRIAADRGTDYELVVRAMDAAGQAGLTHIALETAPGALSGATN